VVPEDERHCDESHEKWRESGDCKVTGSSTDITRLLFSNYRVPKLWRNFSLVGIYTEVFEKLLDLLWKHFAFCWIEAL
jgi:hypothetical protein